MTEGKAAPAAWPSSGSRNLLMRVIAAAVLAPLAIAIAYAGGWLWTALVTLAAIGLYVEWLMIVGARARHARGRRRALSRLRVAGLCLAIGRIDARAGVLGARPRGSRLDLAGAAQLDCGGISLCRGGRDRFGAGAARSGQGIRRADLRAADRVGDRYRRLFRRPRHRRAKTLAAGQPEEDLGGRRSAALSPALRSPPALRRSDLGKSRAVVDASRRFFRWFRNSAISSNPR